MMKGDGTLLFVLHFFPSFCVMVAMMMSDGLSAGMRRVGLLRLGKPLAGMLGSHPDGTGA